MSRWVYETNATDNEPNVIVIPNKPTAIYFVELHTDNIIENNPTGDYEPTSRK